MSLDPGKVSIVHWFPDIQKHRCGYCKQEDCSISFGMWAETLTVEDYQNLVDRGWRRSGKYCYKPIMNETCCPQYTIRCDALNIKLSKSQKRVIKKFNKYLTDGILNKENTTNNTSYHDVNHSNIILKERPEFSVDFTKLKDTVFKTASDFGENDIASCSQTATHVEENRTLATNDKQQETCRIREASGPDPNKPPRKKAKLLRLEKKQKKLEAQGLDLGPKRVDNETKSLYQFLNEIPESSKHKLKMKLISTSNPNDEWVANVDVEYEVYRKYQMIIHNDPPEKCRRDSFIRFLVTTPLKVQLVRMTIKHNLFKLSAKLFAKYQMAIHNDESYECDEKQFIEFLVDTPFQAEIEDDDDNEDVGFGSFHQQYWIDETLIAVGVIDILPRSISSVYFFYDPDYRNLTLGTYGSLRELEFTQNLHTKHPSIEHYYMGFYIHSCPKMRYKGNLHPSELLCPETYCWFPIEKCIPKLDASKYSRLNEDSAAIDFEACSKHDIDAIKILSGYSFTVFRNYKYKIRQKDVFDNIGKLVGKKCAASMLFVNL